MCSYFFSSGDAYKLKLEGPLYLGGLDSVTSSDPLRTPPPMLWTAAVKKGYVGCVRDVVINGKTVDVAEYASRQDSGE